MEKKKFYDEIYEDIIRSIQEFEDHDISERYDCLHDYFLDHENIISQYSTFDFSNEHDESALDRVAKRLLPKDYQALFPVFTKGDGNCPYNSISLLLRGKQSQLLSRIKKPLCQSKWLKRNNFSPGKNWKHGVDIMVTHNICWFRKWLSANSFCSFDPWMTHLCKTKQNSTNTKNVQHYKLFR